MTRPTHTPSGTPLRIEREPIEPPYRPPSNRGPKDFMVPNISSEDVDPVQRRLRDLERRMDEVMRELKRLRKQLARPD